jgi:lipopolysaccharide/colanic/teichoic acid biosynthesis glycosyltransferase
VELIGIFVLALLGIFGAAVSRQLTDEFKAWTPWLINCLIQRAVRQLPEKQRKLRDEEWRSHINDIPGEVGKLYCALGYLPASWKMSRGLTDDTSYAVAKRAFDIASSAIALFLLWPFFPLCAVAMWLAVLLRLDSDGPIFFIEPRVGHKGKAIRLLKFRTLAVPGDGPTVTQGRHGDFPVTSVGMFLRRSGIDEVPQLLNVLSGELSLVGPRPLLSSELDLIDKELPSLSHRKNVKPGLFSWAGVNGFRKESTPLEELKSELEHDLFYIDNRSFMLDLKILLRAIWQSRLL